MTLENPQTGTGADRRLDAMSDDAGRTYLPPLTLLPDRTRDWGEQCDLLCGTEIGPDTLVRIEDRIGRRYCTRCALAAEPSSAAAASTLEHAWRSLLAAERGTANFTDTAAVLRSMADTIDRIERGDLDVHPLLTTTAVGQPRSHCTARPEHWTPPWPNWPGSEI